MKIPAEKSSLSFQKYIFYFFIFIIFYCCSVTVVPPFPLLFSPIPSPHSHNQFSPPTICAPESSICVPWLAPYPSFPCYPPLWSLSVCSLFPSLWFCFAHLFQQVLPSLWRKWNPSILLVGMQTGAATVEESMGFPQKTNNGTAFWSSNPTTGIIP